VLKAFGERLFSSAVMRYRCLDERGNVVDESRFLNFQWFGSAVAFASEWLRVLALDRNTRTEEYEHA
jgi:hypothetical protein